MPGDVVRRLIKGKDTQRGYCRDIHVTACVQVVGTKQVITNVNSKDLVPVEDFTPDVAVCLDSWVGTIKTVRSKLQLAFADGSKCIISNVEACAFEELDERRNTDWEFSHRNDYHPGQVLYGPIGALDEASWISCSKEVKALRSKPQKSIKVVVESVETESVAVNWQCRAYSPDGSCDLKEQPSYFIKGDELKRLKLLNVFEPCSLQIGDRLYYTFKENDTQISKDQWRSQQKDMMLERNPLKGSQKHKSGKEGSGPDKAAEESAPSSPTSLTNELEQGFEKSLGPQTKQNESGTGEDWETDEGTNQDDPASVSSGCSSNSSSVSGGGSGVAERRKKKSPALMTKVLKFKKLRRARRKTPNVLLKPNTPVVVETLVTSSTADVVWQDGSIEYNIPSTQLFPIHHLDDQEFFPGDFVMENKEDGCLRVYGVVQNADHAGRIAVVNWFHTYTSSEDPRPTKLEQNEVSVYDLKDHPDFQYRPGTVAIRVANFEGEDATCTAGQVLDNYPEGRVHVWWVDGHVSMCWPQDLYKVGDYDSDEGELWDDGSSDGSWETESEGSFLGEEEIIDQSIKPKLAANIEKARIAMSRLEELFTQNPALQTLDIMKKLLEVYKDCRYLDKLMGTSFFHENNFQGLLERVREKGRASVGSKVAEQVSRLFQNPSDGSHSKNQNPPPKESEKFIVTYDFDYVDGKDKPINLNEENNFPFDKQSKEAKGSRSAEEKKILINNDLNKENLKKSLHCNGEVNENIDRVNKTIDSLSHTLDKKLMEQKNSRLAEDESPSNVKAKSNDEKSGVSEDEYSNSTEKSPGSANGQVQSSSADDSGVFDHSSISAEISSLTENCDCLTKQLNIIINKSGGMTDYRTSDDKPQENKKGAHSFGMKFGNSCPIDKRTATKMKYQSQSSLQSHVADKDSYFDTNSNDTNASQVCAKLCALIKSQLVKAHAEVTRRFQGGKVPVTLSEVDEKSCSELKQTEEAIVREVTEEKELKTDEKSNKEAVDDVVPVVEEVKNCGEGFSIMANAPNSHKYKLTMCQISEPALFFKTLKKELTLLKTSLPPGIWVKGFEDRTDLYSVMIRGPEKTPFEDGLFVFDFQLPSDYPRTPPLCHYLSYCSDRLNPNLYEEGKVCISLLGTWSGKGTELWTPNSNLLQVIVSFQGLILVNEPYFNEAGYEKQKGTQQGHENSRMYNEMAILKLVQAMTKMVVHPPEVFKDEIKQHFAQCSNRFIGRLQKWLDISEKYIAGLNKESEKVSNADGPSSSEAVTESDAGENSSQKKEALSLQETRLSRTVLEDRNKHWEQSLINIESTADQPEFPLLPASRGFCITLRKSLAAFQNILESQKS
ncbi:UNVERIFIED_CONTAM: hypothetical protein PYX00_000896 [Menopon gallinae]